MHRKALLALASISVTALAVEGMLRLFTAPDYPSRPLPNVHWMVVDPLAGWKNRAGWNADVLERNDRGEPPLRINSLGLRGPEIPAAKPSGAVRIACLGDSGTFGMWYGRGPGGRAVLASMANYPDELRALLAMRGRDDVEIVNAGAAGYTTAHGLRMLRSVVGDLQPDVLVVRYGFNDHLLAWNPARRPISPDSPVLRAFVDAVFSWRLPRAALFLERDWRSDGTLRRSERWVTAEEFAANLRSFIAFGRDRGAHTLLVDYPLRPPGWGDPGADAYWLDRVERASLAEIRDDHAVYQDVLRRVAAEEATPLVQTHARLTQPAPRLFGAYDPIHPSPDGARALAELVLERLDALGWLEGG